MITKQLNNSSNNKKKKAFLAALLYDINTAMWLTRVSVTWCLLASSFIRNHSLSSSTRKQPGHLTGASRHSHILFLLFPFLLEEETPRWGAPPAKAVLSQSLALNSFLVSIPHQTVVFWGRDRAWFLPCNTPALSTEPEASRQSVNIC